MKSKKPNILLVNPWIHDFAAYDFWAKPLGLLYLASILRDHDINVTYMDCLDRFHPMAPETNPYARHGRGPYLKTRIPKPKTLGDVPRNFSRYGIKRQWFGKDLASAPRPDLILVTSHMTYWYPGVQEAIGIIKETFSDVPVVLGGIYASLCHAHAAENSGADRVVIGPGEEEIFKLVYDYTGYSAKLKFDPSNLDAYPYPAFDLQRKIPYVPLITSTGCPFSCSYCASHFLNPERRFRNPELVVKEILYWHKKYGVTNFVFYDDALLADSKRHAVPILRKIINEKIKIHFHTPNAVHIREISKNIADLMYRAGFVTLRLGLETALFEKRGGLDKKVTEQEFNRAVTYLKEAGFKKSSIGAYLLAGLPEQSAGSLEDSVTLVRKRGITPVLAYYSPIPQTKLWDRAVKYSRYDLASDPIYTNNAIFPCLSEALSSEKISNMKKLSES